MKNGTKKNRHFGKDPLLVGGLYELRTVRCCHDRGEVTEHSPVKVRTVQTGEDGVIRVGVSFKTTPQPVVLWLEVTDVDGYDTEVGCFAFPSDLRAAVVV